MAVVAQKLRSKCQPNPGLFLGYGEEHHIGYQSGEHRGAIVPARPVYLVKFCQHYDIEAQLRMCWLVMDEENPL